MANITTNTRKAITLNNEIFVGDKIVVGQTATINSETKKINFSDWTNDMDLYQEYRAEIRELMAQFEDEAFTEKDKLLTEGE